MKEKEPSATALLIAKATVFIARDPRYGRLVPPDAAAASAWFVEAGSPHAKRRLSRIDRPWFRWLAFALERFTVPGILLHYTLRKKYLEEVARRSLNEGFRQVVILAAGFDTLALRFHTEFQQATFIEVDHPATQTLKKQALAGRGLPGDNMHLLAVDFARHDLEQTLLPFASYSREADTLFVAEGLLMYLQSEEVDRLFRFIAGHGGSRVRFAFTFLEPQAGGRPNIQGANPAVDLWLRRRGEPYHWGIGRPELAGYLAARQFTLREITTPRELRARYLGPHPSALASGDFVCFTDRA